MIRKVIKFKDVTNFIDIANKVSYVAKCLECEITFKNDGIYVDACSIIGLTSINLGSDIIVEIVTDDVEEANSFFRQIPPFEVVK